MALLSVSASPSSPILRFKVDPYIQQAPGKITVSFRVEPNADDREFCIGVVNKTDGSYRTGCQPLSGSGGLRDFRLKYDRLSPGDYEVILEVYRHHGGIVQIKKVQARVEGE